MASMELQSVETVKEVEDKRPDMDAVKSGQNETGKNKRNKKKKKKKYIAKFGCFRSEKDDYPTVDRSDGAGGLDMESGCAGKDHVPTHLVIMVHGIIGSAQNWRFAAKQFLKKYPHDTIVHCSECNSSMLTFDGIDVMGQRLADEVISVIIRHPDLQKISFVGHSLGGLIARYAIAKLYDQDITRKPTQQNKEDGSDQHDDPCPEEKYKGKIAGLEPMNFITFATPHLGSRGHKQVPGFCGLYSLEKVASRTSGLLGRTGRHLFLTDGDKGKLPLLLQMVEDCDGLPFMSALQCFRRRVAYANACFDHIVGWSTSSLRRRAELPKRQNLSRNDKYPHVVNEEAAKTVNPQKELSSGVTVNGYKTIDMEETMLRSLTKLSWERVDVSFHGSKQRFFAHSTIQVKTVCINSDGADVVQHMIDGFLL